MTQLTSDNSTVLQVGAALEQGGVERGIMEMANYLAGEGYGSHVASAGGQYVGKLQSGVVHHILPLTTKNPLQIIANALKICQIIKREQINLLHVRSRAPAFSIWLASKLTGTPYVTTFHGIHGHKSALKRWYNRIMLRGAAVIANSYYTQNHIHEVYDLPLNDIHVAQRGVDLAEFDPAKVGPAQLEAIRREFNLASLTPLILIPGRLSPTKGHAVVLAALAELTDLEWQAVIVGGGPYRHEVEKLITQHTLGDRVQLAGSRTDLPIWFKLATISVVASEKPEAFGRVIAESMAMGTPVVAANHGGAPEIIPNDMSGLLFKPGDHKELVKHLTTALADQAWQKRASESAQAHVRANFTVAKMCAAEVKVYQEILGS